jgi:branched-chain amino acid transport system permease protein
MSLSAEVIQQIINGLVIGATYSLMAVGLTMIFGMMDVINFAHGELYMLGGVFAYFLIVPLGLNYFVSICLAVLLVMLIGLAFDQLVLRKLRGEPILITILVTIGLSIFLQNVVLLFWGPSPQRIQSPFSTAPIVLGSVVFTRMEIFMACVTCGVIFALQAFIKWTSLGRKMRAAFQDPDAARIVGIDINQIYAINFALGSGLAGLAGSMLGTLFIVYPNMGQIAIMKAFLIVIMGGMGNFLGAIFGGLLLGVVESMAAGFLSSGYKDLFGLLIVMVLLIFRPYGLFGRKV